MLSRDVMLELHDLTLGYDGQPAVRRVSGAFQQGSLTAIVGPNGAGKSSLLRALVGQLRPMGGHISRAAAVNRIAYLPQQSELDRNVPVTVHELVCLGAWHRIGVTGGGDTVARDADDALLAVGLERVGERLVHSLSMGQLQRALFARVILTDAPVILLDEPFSAMDGRTTRDLMTLIFRWQREQRTIIAVLHDLDQVRSHFPQCLLLARELVAWGRTEQVLTASSLNLAHKVAERWEESVACGAQGRFA
jgi:zinc/manganese transport system ATP-binding protein